MGIHVGAHEEGNSGNRNFQVSGTLFIEPKPQEPTKHHCHHELETARINGLLGNIDANTGDPQIGWDTDQSMTDISEATMVMLSVIRNGGLAPGGFNFDAKLRRESTEVEDIFLAHISGMDTLARGLRSAAKLIQDGSLAELVRKRYQSFDTEIGAQVEAGKGDFETLEKLAMKWGEPKVPSAKQELAEMIFQSALSENNLKMAHIDR
ncbi:hypothetical protein H0E87_029450 [Populus deltoides]|uniref:Xylose isomerase n=1 Tax=Populus deltoides TaxID=3696 RepID=A0A8T2WMJ1_POPDE|nr:hypothetical protein H0E87_029450 [Populus deltoides]